MSQHASWRVALCRSLGVIGIIACLCAGCASPRQPAASSAPTSGPTDPKFSWTHGGTSSLDTYVQRYVNAMSLDAKIGQLIYAQTFSGGVYAGQTAEIIREIQPGGLIIYQGEVQSATQAQTYFHQIQADSRIPVLIGTDNEGGAEWRIDTVYPTAPPAAYQIGATNDPAYAYQQGIQMAQMMRGVGMNTDLAPVVDVNPYGASRDFGTTPDQVTKMAGAWLNGLQASGIVGTLKHFPGLGGAPFDPHTGLPTVSHSKDTIENVDLAPFRNLINSADPPGMIMSTDILLPAIDDMVPAEVSSPIITGLLRNELHYDGVVMTDALYMGGMGQYMCAVDNVPACDPLTYARNNPQVLARLGVMALQAGNDMLLGTFDLDNTRVMVQAIKDAITAGKLTQARIDQSVTRIIRLKLRFGLIPLPATPEPGAPAPQTVPEQALLVPKSRIGV